MPFLFKRPANSAHILHKYFILIACNRFDFDKTTCDELMKQLFSPFSSPCGRFLLPSRRAAVVCFCVNISRSSRLVFDSMVCVPCFFVVSLFPHFLSLIKLCGRSEPLFPFFPFEILKVLPLTIAFFPFARPPVRSTTAANLFSIVSPHQTCCK